MKKTRTRYEMEELSEKQKKYTWDQINTAMTMIGFGPRVIVKLLSKINRVVKERLTVNPKLQETDFDEATTAGTGVGDYSPPLGMQKRISLLSQFDQCTRKMDRKGMLGQCRKMGLSLSHLKDDDLRKTLSGMSLRNKRKFMGVSMGMGMGNIDRWVKTPKQV